MATPIFLILSHHLAVFAHEYAHATMAWILGYKRSPFDINYGGMSALNILLLLNIDQAVDNVLIYSQGHPYYVALIAFVGSGTNALLYVWSYLMLQKKSIQLKPYRFYFIFLFNLMNLANVYDYVPIRTFATEGVMVDVLDVEQGFGLSPWWIYAIVGYLVAFMIWQFFSKTLILAYTTLQLKSTLSRASLMIVCVLILFGYFSLPGLFAHGPIPPFITKTALLAIPGIIFCLWPSSDRKTKKL
jgi:hypothetical protein